MSAMHNARANSCQVLRSEVASLSMELEEVTSSPGAMHSLRLGLLMPSIAVGVVEGIACME